MKLSRSEIDTLLAAVEAWVVAPHQSGMVSAMIEVSMKNQGQAEAESCVDAAMQKATAAAAARKETAILLSAKLIHMRIDNEIGEVAS